MKPTTIKVAALALISMLSIANAEARGWQCQVHNARGESWKVTAMSSNSAMARAMSECQRNPMNAGSCKIDWCQANIPTAAQSMQAPPQQPIQKRWQCDVTNARGQVFIGMALSQPLAASRAQIACAKRSALARNCMMKSCILR